MARDYLQDALTTFNGGMWYGWKTHDDSGNKIPNEDRMPTEAEVNAKIQELKDAETAHTNARTTGKAKLKSGEALTDAEIKALFGDN